MPPKPEEPLSADEKAIAPPMDRGRGRGPARRRRGRPDAAGSITGRSPRRRVRRPPAVRDGSRVRGPVDRFIQRALEDRGLTLGPDADRRDLDPPPQLRPDRTAAVARGDRGVRRRPGARTPTNGSSIACWPRPDYGERWGKHWLDASGYADSNGYFSADTDRPLAYRYRDYVIRAFNADRPLDQVVREQLAGDELAGGRRGPGTPPEVVDQLVATHFLRNSQDGTGESDGNPDEVRADKYAVLEGTAQVIGSSLLGLTIQCARCHDHKFEPVTQKDYYQLQAILYPAFNVEHWVKPNDRAGDRRPARRALRWEAHDKAIDVEIAALKRSIRHGPEAVRKKKEEALKPIIEAIEAPSASEPRADRRGSATSRANRRRSRSWSGATPPTPGPKVGPGVPAFLTDPDNRYEPDPPWPGSSSTGRRLALARWLTRPGSRPAALLARVLANRIWQHHFGTGLAATLREPRLHRLAAEPSRAARVPGRPSSPDRAGVPGRSTG